MGIPMLLLFRKPDKRRGVSTPVVPGLTFLFDEQFVTDDAAPLTIPRNAEPGPGAWDTLNDAGNRLSIASGVLAVAAGGGFTDPNLYSSTTFARAIGLALTYTIPALAVTNVLMCGFRTNTGTADWRNQAGVMPASVTTIRNYNTSSSSGHIIVVPTMSGVNVAFYTILRTAGYWGVYKQAGAYYLTMVHATGTGTNLPLHLGGSSAGSMDNVRVAQLGSPWTNDDNLLTYRVASPVSGATNTSLADAIHVVTWTPASGETLDLIFRRTDDDNCWIFRQTQGTTDNRKIIKVEGGTPTELVTSSFTLNAGTAYRITVRTRGQQVDCNTNGATLSSYATASFQETATGTKITKDGAGTIATWEAWQVNITGASATELDKMDV